MVNHNPRNLPLLTDTKKLEEFALRAAAFSKVHPMFSIVHAVANAAIYEYLANLEGFTTYPELAKQRCRYTVSAHSFGEIWSLYCYAENEDDARAKLRAAFPDLPKWFGQHDGGRQIDATNLDLGPEIFPVGLRDLHKRFSDAFQDGLKHHWPGA